MILCLVVLGVQCGLEGKKIGRDREPGSDSCEILSLSQGRTERRRLAFLSGAGYGRNR